MASQQDVEDAVRSAQQAFETFSQTTLEHRKGLLSKFKDAVMEVAEELTDLLCVETGKPVSWLNRRDNASLTFILHSVR